MSQEPALINKDLSKEEIASRWSQHAAAYRRPTEDAIFPFALTLVDECHQFSPLDVASAKALDNGSGPGVTTAALKSLYPSLHVISADISQGMIDSVISRIKDAGWEKVEARVLDAQNLRGIEDASLSHVLSTFMVCLVPEPKKVVAEMLRVTRPGGVLGLAVWGDPYFGAFNTPWTKACRELDPGYQSVAIMDDEWTSIANVEERLKEAGYVDVTMRELTMFKEWGSLDEACNYFWEGGNPALMLLHESWKDDGRPPLEGLKPIFRRLYRESIERDGKVVSEFWVTMGKARKPG